MRKLMTAAAALSLAVATLPGGAVAEPYDHHDAGRYEGSCHHARHHAAIVGALIGGVGGALLGNAVAGGGGRLGGTLIGAGVGAVAGHEVGKHSRRC